MQPQTWAEYDALMAAIRVRLQRGEAVDFDEFPDEPATAPNNTVVEERVLALGNTLRQAQADSLVDSTREGASTLRVAQAVREETRALLATLERQRMEMRALRYAANDSRDSIFALARSLSDQAQRFLDLAHASTKLAQIREREALVTITQPFAVDRFDAVLDAVCVKLHVRRNDLLSRRRTQEVSNARFIAYYLLREVSRPQTSFPRIGRHFGRDHSSIIHGYQLVARRAATEPAYMRMLTELRLQLLDQAPPAESSAEEIAA